MCWWPTFWGWWWVQHVTVSSTRDPWTQEVVNVTANVWVIKMVSAWITSGWCFCWSWPNYFSFRSRILYNEDGYFWRGANFPRQFRPTTFQKNQNLTNPPRPKYDSRKSLMFCLFTLLLRVKNHIKYWGVGVLFKESLRQNPAAANVRLWFWLVQSSSPPRHIWVTARFRSVFETFPLVNGESWFPPHQVTSFTVEDEGY